MWADIWKWIQSLKGLYGIQSLKRIYDRKITKCTGRQNYLTVDIRQFALAIPCIEHMDKIAMMAEMEALYELKIMGFHLPKLIQLLLLLDLLPVNPKSLLQDS